MAGMASVDQRPLHQQPASAQSQERSDHHDRSEPVTGEVTGFRFECQPGCSACCEMEGEVFLTEEDLIRIAAYLSTDLAEFEQKYVHRTARSLRLRKPSDRQCLFHQDQRCSIHPVK